MATVGLVLLIACANIGKSLTGEGHGTPTRNEPQSGRSAPRACGSRVRSSSRSLLLSGAGALLGLLFARWASTLLVTQLSTVRDAVVLDLTLDWRVLAFTTAVAIGTACCSASCQRCEQEAQNLWRH